MTLLLGATAAAAFSTVPLYAQGPARDHQYTSADLEAGSRIYRRQCTLCHGPSGTLIPSVDLRRGVFKRSVTDTDLASVLRNGVAGTPMPPSALGDDEIGAVIAFIRAGFDRGGTDVRIGDPETGRALFAGKGDCASCHRVNGKGPRTAPDLSEIGAIRSASTLQRSLTDPTAGMWPINRPVRIVTADGKTLRGRRLNEDTFTVQLITDDERLVSLDKAGLREFEINHVSPMAPKVGSLTTDEVAALVGYLMSLKGLP